ncbi:MAG: oligosaccharide flippase family protein, partial [Candidatus Schmidhempelia sp.]|nr:oligosaccharide flippase family protein [Candidatus Schmidhempelia sp.]
MASLKKNILSLFLVQIFNYIIPLLQLPYLSRVLGIELFGVMAFMLALIQFINVLTDYGFNLYIPQIVAGGRDSRHQVSVLSSNIFLLKLGFSLLGYILFWGIIFFNSSYDAYHLYAFIVSLSIIGNALFPICIYQGLEKLTTISKMIISCKLVALVLIIILVKAPTDFIYIAIINTSQIILLTLIAFIGLYKQQITLKFSFIDHIELVQLLTKAFPFFIS